MMSIGSPQSATKWLVLLGLTAIAACGNDASTERQQAEPPTVIVAPAELKDINTERSYTGRIEAIDKVQIRARVAGFLKQRSFAEGADVTKGDLMFEIDPEPFEIASTEAEANLESAKAAMTLAQQTFDRTQQLVQRNVSTQANLDDARAKLQQAKAAVLAQEAALRKARLDLSYTRISAPMDGRVGRAAYSAGAYISGQDDVLATLVQQNPVYVTFPVPQALLLQVRKEGRAADSVLVRLRLADGSLYKETGSIRFAENQATASTDSVVVRASIPNPDNLLVDQQIVEVEVVRKKPVTKLLVPQTALLLDQQGSYVLSISTDSKVEIKRIETGEQIGTQIIVESGLAAGDRIIVSGHQKVQPGQIVNPQTAGGSPEVPKSPSEAK